MTIINTKEIYDRLESYMEGPEGKRGLNIRILARDIIVLAKDLDKPMTKEDFLDMWSRRWDDIEISRVEAN